MKTSKTATLNICGLGDKTSELIDFMQNKNIEILGLADIRKKGNKIKEMNNKYVLMWSGVDNNLRAKHGVGFLIHPNKAKTITDIEYISERIIRIQLMERERNTTLIQIYAPCNNNNNIEERNEFFERLSSVLNKINDKDELYVMGDFNGRIGGKKAQREHCLGNFGDTTTERNSNGEELINLCLEQGLIITNSLYQHRESHIKTWYKWDNLLQSSQIDYILTRYRQKINITDARVIPNMNIDTDHRPVVLIEKRLQLRRTTEHKDTRHWKEPVLNLKTLDDDTKREELFQEMAQIYDILPTKIDNIQTEWELFKTHMLKNLQNICGTRSPRKSHQKTVWWTEDIQKAIQTKKQCFKIWLKSKNQDDYLKYQLARRNVKHIIKEAKEKSWCKYGEQLTDLCKKSPRDFFKSVKSMRVRDESYNPITIINSKDGTPILNSEERKARWKEYFQELYNPNSITKHTYEPRAQETLEPEILSQEIDTAIKNSPRNKSPGADGIPNEAIKACREIGVKWLKRIFTAAWTERKVPDDWQKSVIVPLWKNKGNKRECETYRGISLLSHTGKIYTKIIEQRVRYILEPQLSPSQLGFRRGVGCTDALFTLRQLSEKAIEYGKELDILFVDQEKAFDRVDRNILWETLENYGIKGHLLENIRALYQNCQSAVRTTEGLTDTFETRTGVRQGCVLSPLLFNVYIDRVITEAQIVKDHITETEQENEEQLNITEEDDIEDQLNNTLNELLFADDQCLIYDDEERLQNHTNSLLTTCRKYNMNINIQKTETMRISKSPSPLNIHIGNTKVKQVTEFKYLGSIFTESGRLDREIETRCQKANVVTYQLSPLLLHPKIKMEVKKQMINTIFMPTLCYQCQTWPLTSEHQRKLTTCEMKCLRKAAGVTRLDRLRNDDIRNRVGTTSCKEYIERQQISWFGHLMRMNHNQIPAIAYNKTNSGYRPKGRPRKRWIDNIRDTLSKHGHNTTSATHLALQRKLKLPPLRSTASVENQVQQPPGERQ
jgi:hypothetical protein